MLEGIRQCRYDHEYNLTLIIGLASSSADFACKIEGRSENWKRGPMER